VRGARGTLAGAGMVGLGLARGAWALGGPQRGRGAIQTLEPGPGQQPSDAYAPTGGEARHSGTLRLAGARAREEEEELRQRAGGRGKLCWRIVGGGRGRQRRRQQQQEGGGQEERGEPLQAPMVPAAPGPSLSSHQAPRLPPTSVPTSSAPATTLPSLHCDCQEAAAAQPQALALALLDAGLASLTLAAPASEQIAVAALGLALSDPRAVISSALSFLDEDLPR
jgi:hypothetical protein